LLIQRRTMSTDRPRVLVVYKKSAYQIYVRERRHPRVAALLRKNSPAVAGMVRAHEDHLGTVAQVRRVLAELGVRAVFRQRRERGSTAGFHLVVTVGGDGTLLWASQMVPPGVPVLAINSAPKDSVGYFCAAASDEVPRALGDAIAGKLKATELTRMQVAIDGKVVHKRVLNDVLFSHYCPAATTRYSIRFAGRVEEHKSSGVWVATAAGSTAAIRSAGGRVLPIGSRELQFAVREPYALGERRYRVLNGAIRPNQHLEIQSHVRAGRLYIDGPHVWRAVDIGSVLRMSRSDEPLLLLGFRPRARPR
jgi:NAD+ kinase